MYRLRELESKDLKEINSWRNNPEIISYLAAPYRYINLAVDDMWFENYMHNRGNTVRCSIVDKEDNILGLVSLTGIDHLNQSAELHIMIGNNCNQNKGIGSFAIKEMLNHAFNNLNLHRVQLAVLDNNKRAKHVYEKSGFIREGTLRQAVYKNGNFLDMHLYSVLKNEYIRVIRK